MTEKPKNTPKIPKVFICESCSFNCSNKKDFNRHLLTTKHKKMTMMTQMITINPVNDGDHNKSYYICKCGKQYQYRQGLYVHSKKCTYNSNKMEEIIPEEVDYKELLIEAMKTIHQKDELVSDAMKQLAEQQKQMADMIPLIGNNNNNNTTNNKFNLNFFLNETCKDALNIKDFIDSLQIQLNDLDQMNELGYVNGVSRIILNGLNQLDLTKRPLHCSDAKREILYVKENNEWDKEESKTKLTNAISIVGRKTFKHFPEWMEKHPNCNDNNSKENEEYHTLIKNTITQNTDDNKTKVAKNIIKQVVIDK